MPSKDERPAPNKERRYTVHLRNQQSMTVDASRVEFGVAMIRLCDAQGLLLWAFQNDSVVSIQGEDIPRPAGSPDAFLTLE